MKSTGDADQQWCCDPLIRGLEIIERLGIRMGAGLNEPPISHLIGSEFSDGYVAVAFLQIAVDRLLSDLEFHDHHENIHAAQIAQKAHAMDISNRPQQPESPPIKLSSSPKRFRVFVQLKSPLIDVSKGSARHMPKSHHSLLAQHRVQRRQPKPHRICP